MKKSQYSKAVWGWAMYDFANSAYTTSILTVIFSVYFVKTVVPPEGAMIWGTMVNGTSLWGFINSAVMACVMVAAPGLGALADHANQKRFQLVLWAVLGCAGTMLLVLARPGWVGLSTGLIFLTTLAYELSLVFYNAFLKDIAPDEESGRVSGFGFALGYIGGGVCLGLNMIMIAQPAWFGLGSFDPTIPVRISFLVVGAWWLLFSIPTFFWVKDPTRDYCASRHSRESGNPALDSPLRKPGFPIENFGNDDLLGRLTTGFSTSFLQSFRQLRDTLKHIWQKKDTRNFLLSYILYNDGIQTIILMAAIFGAQALSMTTTQLGLCYLMIQFVAFGGAMGFGALADKWSHKNVVLLTLVAYAAVTIWGMVMKSSFEFWILGFVIGLILGGSQAASRSLFALMTPSDKSGEYFALFSVVGKASAMMGPFVFGVVNQLWGLRPAVGSLLLFFVVGGGILFLVKEPSMSSKRLL